MRVLFLGDLIGRAGREAAAEALPKLRRKLTLDAIIINAENASGGFGLRASIAEDLFDAGADILTLGNHAFDHRDMLTYLDKDHRVIRPLNIAKEAPGRGVTMVTLPTGQRVVAVNVLGRVMMQSYDDPFPMIDRVLNENPLGSVCDFLLVDMHAEATSEKMAMGLFCNGRASVVVGTHTHIPTADHRILSKGTAYQTDVGMCGNYHSVIGMDAEEPMYRFLTGMRRGRYEPKGGPVTLCGLLIETNDETGLANSVAPLRIGGELDTVWPQVTD